MIKHFFSIFILFIALPIHAQDLVQWNYAFDASTESIELTATIAEGWHLYSQEISGEIGPIPTSFEFEESRNFKTVGDVVEPESIREYDPNFEGELNFFKDVVTFRQKVKVKKSTDISGSLTYMICNATKCIPPKDEVFTIHVEPTK